MTLVEMLLAVTLFSTMLGATAALLQSGLRAQLSWGQSVEPAVRLERALSALERDLGSSQRLFAVPVIGAGSQLELARVEASQWVRVRYRVAEDAGQTHLLRETLGWSSEPSDPPLTTQVLLSLTSGAFAYGHADDQGLLIWKDVWDGAQQGLPKLVQFSCEIPTASGSLAITRIFRNPAGILPLVEQQP